MSLGKKKMLHQAAGVSVVNTENFAPVLYTGNGSAQSISTVGFQPDLVWIKSRSTSTNNELHDSLRGEPSRLFSDATNAEMTVANGFVSLDSNGFSLDGTGSGGEVNFSGRTYVAWCWKAADTTTTISAGTVGNTIASDVRANPDAGFSIVKYTGNNTQGATVGHGLNQTPDLIIIKALDNARDWEVFVNGVMTSDTDRLSLNSTSQISTVSYARWDVSGMSNTVFGLSGNSLISDNTNGVEDYIAYCFRSVDGYQKVGSYVGNRPTDVVIDTGFAPRFVMIKCDAAGEDWIIIDSERGDEVAYPSKTPVEAYTGVSLTSTGFTVHNSGLSNTNGATHIYLAIA